LAITDAVAQPTRAATGTVSIVWVGGDPIQAGFVTSLARPGGNITGVTVNAGSARPSRVRDVVSPPTTCMTSKVPGATYGPRKPIWCAGNGSGVSGVAHIVATRLQRAGFAIGEVGNAASSDVAKTEIDEHSKITWAGAKVRSALPSAMQQAPISATVAGPSAATPGATAPPSDVTIVVGKDLATALVAQSASPSP